MESCTEQAGDFMSIRMRALVCIFLKSHAPYFFLHGAFSVTLRCPIPNNTQIEIAYLELHVIENGEVTKDSFAFSEGAQSLLLLQLVHPQSIPCRTRLKSKISTLSHPEMRSDP